MMMGHQGLRKESNTIAIVVLCFGISYLLRWLWDTYFKDELYDATYFGYLLTSNLGIIIFSDGLTLFSLLWFHFINFEAPKDPVADDSESILDESESSQNNKVNDLLHFSSGSIDEIRRPSGETLESSQQVTSRDPGSLDAQHSLPKNNATDQK